MNLDTMLTAADTANLESGGRSFFEKAGDALTAGVAGAVVSGLGSIYNTAAFASNKLFGTELDDIDTARVLDDVNANWGRYYEENKGVIDTVGFIGGAFIPGGLAVKGLNVARNGTSLGAFGNALGYTTRKQASYLKAALDDLANTGTDVFTTLNKNKLASMAYGAADNVLQAAVFESAAALAMNQNPLLVNENWSDISWDIVKTSLAGGLIGGGIEALWTNKIVRDAGKLVEKGARKYDSLEAMEKMGMAFGDEAFSLMDSVLALPKQVLEADKALEFSFRLNGKTVETALKTGGLYEKKLEETFEKGLQLFQSKLANVVRSDTSVGSPFAASLVDIVRIGKKEGQTETQIREKLGDYLFNLRSVDGLGASPVDFTKEVVYFTPGAAVNNLTDVIAAFSSKKVSSNDVGYRIVGSVQDTKIATVGIEAATIKDAFDAGFDVVIAPGGRFRVNPQSKIYRPVSSKEDDVVRVAYNTRTKQTADSTIATAADMATGERKLSVTPRGVTSGNFVFEFATDAFKFTADTVRATARHLWARQHSNLDGVTIEWNDFSLLDHLYKNLDPKDTLASIRLASGSVVRVSEVGNLRNFIASQKSEMAQQLLNEAAKTGDNLDTRTLAYLLNTEQTWVEKAIAQSFDVAKMQGDDMIRPLESYSVRENLLLTYNKPAKVGENGDEITGHLAYEYRKKLAIDRANEASAFVLGSASSRFLDIGAGDLRARFDATGTGATGAGFANADYTDPARVWAQDVGRAVHLTKQQFRNQAIDQVQPFAQEIIVKNKKELGALLTRVRLSERSLTLWNGLLVDLASLKKYKKQEALVLEGKARPETLEKFGFLDRIELDEDVYKFLEAYHEGHKAWVNKQRVLASAQGRTLPWDEDALYLPPIDTRKVPYFAFVRATDGSVFSSAETAMITARTPEELQRLANQVKADHPNLQVIFKGDTEDYYKAKGDYDFASGLNSPTIDPLLRKQGKLGDFLPTLEPQAVVEEFIRFIGNREDNLVRNAVQVKYGQTFSELRYLSSQYTKLGESKFSFLDKLAKKGVRDPFGDYARTALDISKRAEFTLWHEANEFVDALGTRAYQAVERTWLDAKEGKTDWIEANRVLEKMNLGAPFKDQAGYLEAQAGSDRSLIKIAVAKGNMLLANVALRLDAANSLLNVISAPILIGTEVSSIRRSLAKDPELLARFEDQLSVAGENGLKIPSTTKLLYSAVANFWSPSKRDLIARYTDIGAVRDDVSKFHDMMEDLSLVPNMNSAKWAKKVDEWTEKGATLTGNNGTELFTRFVAADVMRQITQPVVDAGKMSIKEQNSFISIFVNRAQGNYIASQRPIMFQGVIGAAIGLFQTYQFNMFQQLFRHIENRDGRTLAVAAGLQSSIFGLNGLPMFDAINTHLIGTANINEGHHDIYSMAVRATGKEMGDAALYGVASAFPLFTDKMPALYTRGDLNPRHLTIVPTSFADIPIVQAGTRLASSIWGIGNNIMQGGELGNALLHGLEHNGVSRPLAGLAQVISGESTTSKGSLIAANGDFMSVTTAARLLGAKPMDESVAMNHRFRLRAYEAADKERLEELGVVIKQKIRDGGLTEEDILDFGSRYAAAGGRIQNYGAALQRWMKSANQSEVNTLMRAHGSQYGQRLLEVMGGDPLEDLATQAPPEE